MSLTQREAFARLMEHMCRHDGSGGHGYSQPNRMGDGTVEWVDLGDGVRVSVAGGDRDCSSAVVTCLRAVGVDTYGATYTGNMREELLRTGLFAWHPTGDGYVAQRGDVYLNEGHHTAVCTCADPDTLAQFSRSETCGITGREGDQDGYESNIRGYYSYPWDGKLAWLNDGKVLGGTVSDVADATDPDLGDCRYWGQKFSRELQRQRGTTVDGIISGQCERWLDHMPAVDRSTLDLSGRGSMVIGSCQRMWGVEDDEIYGEASIKGHQRWLIKHGYDVGEDGADGYHGRDTNQAMAKALKAGAYRG